MAALQEALQCLTSTPRDEIPTDQASLRSLLTTLRSQARLIVDSVPEPPPEKSASTNSSSSSSKSKHKYKIIPSPARLSNPDSNTPDSSETAAAAHEHQQAWSKQIVKPTHSKDNPLSVPVYKLPGSDGQGHWFGRRSVHEGLPYEVWEEKLSTEITETLRRNQKRVEQGLPPDQAVRGIGAERVVEEVIVRDGDGDANVMGKFTIYHVRATFPKPTTSRDFVAMIVTWENEHFKEREKEGKWSREGRSWMMLSRPCEHPDAPPVGEFIRGQYESVEMIREILVDKDGSEGSESGSGSGSKGANGEFNPVEWIMVTRSDPGGTIPRWMVEKGTPKSICTDAAKFVDWAREDPEAAKEKERLQSAAKSEGKESMNAEEESESEEDSDSDSSEYEQEEHHGLIASFGSLLNAGIERYAPQAVLDYIPHHSRESSYNIPGEFKDSDEDTTTHHQTKRQADADADETQSQTSVKSETPAEPTTSAGGDVNLDITAAELLEKTGKSKLSSHERQLAKLAQEKRSIEAQLDLVRSDIESLGLRAPEDKDKEDIKKETASARASADSPSGHQHQQRAGSSDSSTKAKHLGSDDRTSSNSNLRSRGETPAPAADSPKMQKVAAGLFREESKLVQKLSKIERHQLKEAEKIEARHRKDAEKQGKARSRDANESLRRELEQTKKECEKLRSERKQWLDLIKSLQAENSKLAGQLGVKGEKGEK
ncbi:hypothetical protein ASPVEDRAFT_63550 [Aspergillus versicolor CBS 583.65]|uniref:DUF3074 domain-containing protein n=1 Tax=Aspergillus versicolor CBS 583.65 TaxID=1036611 RepID=A0A1L9PRC2_ASPVE|nr:uncharacterized protein ASPVEDRAFT_63550 [Aspergillus versicolor CBS 583.65]OJJ04070.1 hypothetical protein ASPVEDRAFT_63550 [Aspergillus versicolor CBS 583.65]